ncbi:MAG: hypothetical protein ACRDRF_00510, partial [Pseudonocardiaceae bacterium]
VRVLEYTNETRRQSTGSQLDEEDVVSSMATSRWVSPACRRRRKVLSVYMTLSGWSCGVVLGIPCCNRVRWRFTVFLVGERTTR